MQVIVSKDDKARCTAALPVLFSESDITGKAEMLRNTVTLADSCNSLIGVYKPFWLLVTV